MNTTVIDIWQKHRLEALNKVKSDIINRPINNSSELLKYVEQKIEEAERIHEKIDTTKIGMKL